MTNDNQRGIISAQKARRVFIMLNRKASAIVSLVLCFIVAAALIVMLFLFPSSAKERLGEPMIDGLSITHVTVAYYLSMPFAFAALYMLTRLLLNLIHNRVFIKKNITYIHLISWCCYGAAVMTALASLAYPVFTVLLVAEAFMGTILRVVKSAFESAVALREENDLTI